jgi:hypothetical protein
VESAAGRHPDDNRRPSPIDTDPTAVENQIVPVRMMRFTFSSGAISSSVMKNIFLS